MIPPNPLRRKSDHPPPTAPLDLPDLLASTNSAVERFLLLQQHENNRALAELTKATRDIVAALDSHRKDIAAEFDTLRAEAHEDRKVHGNYREQFTGEFRVHVATEEVRLNLGLKMIAIFGSLCTVILGSLSWYFGHYVVAVTEFQGQTIAVNSNRLTALEVHIRSLLERK